MHADVSVIKVGKEWKARANLYGEARRGRGHHLVLHRVGVRADTEAAAEAAADHLRAALDALAIPTRPRAEV